MCEVEKIHKRLDVSPRQDVLADSSPVHAFEVLLCHMMCVIAAVTTTAGASTRQVRLALWIGFPRVARGGRRTVA